MPSTWTFSALRPKELALPMPSGDGADPMWRLMKPCVRRSVAPHQVADAADRPGTPERHESFTTTQGEAHAQ